MVDWHQAAEALADQPMFRSVPAQDLARFLSRIEILDLDEGGSLHTSADEADKTYLLLRGRFEVIGIGGGVTEISKGFLGEEAAIGLEKYLATATSIGETQVIAMPKDALSELAEHGPLVEGMMQSYSRRFAANDPHQKTVALAPDSKQKKNLPLRVTFGWAFASLAPLLLYLTLNDAGILPNRQSVYLLAILSAAVVMWVFRLLPDFIPALFAVLGIILFGLAPPDVALSGFSSNTFFMALSIFGLSAVITVSGLSYRVMLRLLQVGPANKAWYNISLFLSGLALTPIVPTANGRVAIMAPLANDMLRAIGPAAQQEGPRLTASVMGGATLLSAIFLSSKATNFLIFGLLPLQEQARFQWLYWLFAASVVGIIVLVRYALATWLMFRNDSNPAVSKDLVRDQLKILGPMNLTEWSAVLGLGVLLISFLTVAVHRIDIPWIALAILFSLLMFQCLSARDFRQRIDWSFLIYLASLIGLVAAMGHVGLDQWISGNLTWLQRLMSDDLPLFIAMLAVTIFVVRLALPINAAVVIFATVLIPTAINISVNPWLIGFIIVLMADCFVWPHQASYFLQFQSMARPEAGVNDPRLAWLHFLIFFMKLAAIYLSFPFWQSLGII